MRFIVCLFILQFSLVSNAQVWSNDGKHIAFFYLHEVEDIYIVRDDGSGFRIIDDHPDRDFGMSWSPKGDELIFTSIRDGHHELYRKNLDTGDLIKLTHSKFNSEGASYSPDGKRLVFANDSTGNSELYIMDLESKEIRQVTETTTFNEFSPRWSYDGSALLFVGSIGDDQWDVYRCDLDGGNRSNLTKTPERGEFHPAWSPDGSSISFVSVVDGIFEIHILDIERDADTVIVKKPGYQAFFPSWSPDGRWIAFTRNVVEGETNGYPALYKVYVSSKEEQLITNRNSFHLYE